MDYVLGIDQGGTKTAAAIMDIEGTILGSGFSRGACHASDGMDAAMSAVKAAYDGALLMSGLKLKNIGYIAAGLTGMDWPEEYTTAREALCKLTGIRHVSVFNDCIVAMRGGTEKPYGAVICAGTGLNVGVRDFQGQTCVFGYYIDGEYQGAYALGNRALRAVFASECGILGNTALTRLALGFFNAGTVDDLLRKYTSGKITDNFKKFAPFIFQAAGEGDAVAASIIDSFGRGAAEYAVAGLRMRNMDQAEVDVVLSGSVLNPGNTMLKESICSVIYEKCPGAHVRDAVYEPVVGACLSALDELLNSGPGFKDNRNVQASSKIHNLMRKEI